MSTNSTTTGKRDHVGMTAEDWKRLDGLTDEEIMAAALSDPDAQLITTDRLRPPALSKFVRNHLRMTRQAFAEAYGIPIETLASWERYETEPSAAEAAYLRLIAREPERAKLPSGATVD